MSNKASSQALFYGERPSHRLRLVHYQRYNHNIRFLSKEWLMNIGIDLPDPVDFWTLECEYFIQVQLTLLIICNRLGCRGVIAEVVSNCICRRADILNRGWTTYCLWLFKIKKKTHPTIFNVLVYKWNIAFLLCKHSISRINSCASFPRFLPRLCPYYPQG